jgi:hypothetical protein
MSPRALVILWYLLRVKSTLSPGICDDKSPLLIKFRWLLCVIKMADCFRLDGAFLNLIHTIDQ